MVAVAVWGALASTGGQARAAETPEQAVAETAATAEARRTALAVQGGWWSVEAEWRMRLGVYLAAGIPWMGAALALADHASWVVPLGARVGYDLPLSPRWSVRAGLHGAATYANERGKCGCSDQDPIWRAFLFGEVGLRYQAASGFVAGVNLALVAFDPPGQVFAPPQALAFSELYIGHSWGR